MGFNVSPTSEEGRNRGIATDHPYYGTFQGVANYYPSPVPPASYGGPHHHHAYYCQGQGYHHVVPVPVPVPGTSIYV